MSFLRGMLLVSMMSMLQPALSAPVVYQSSDVLPNGVQEVSAAVELIKSNFRQKFGLEVEVFPELVDIDDENENDLWGVYSFHKIVFGRLSQKEFDVLNEYFQFPIKSDLIPKLIYDPQREYKLVDFLVPKIQPLPGKILWTGVATEHLRRSDLTNEATRHFSANCFECVLDVLTADQDPFDTTGVAIGLDIGGADIMTALTNRWTTKNLSRRKRGDLALKAYDFFIQPDRAFNNKGITHTAVVVGPGLVFEKLAPGGDVYRVAPLFFRFAESERTRLRESAIFRRLRRSLSYTPDDRIRLVGGPDDQIYRYNPLRVELNPNTGNYEPVGIFKHLLRDPILQSCSLDDQEAKICTKGVNQDPVFVDLKSTTCSAHLVPGTKW